MDGVSDRVDVCRMTCRFSLSLVGVTPNFVFCVVVKISRCVCVCLGREDGERERRRRAEVGRWVRDGRSMRAYRRSIARTGGMIGPKGRGGRTTYRSQGFFFQFLANVSRVRSALANGAVRAGGCMQCMRASAPGRSRERQSEIAGRKNLPLGTESREQYNTDLYRLKGS